jgi:(1->4)-alpha-D-glucan 1-alpha-D-glucosylmutase
VATANDVTACVDRLVRRVEQVLKERWRRPQTTYRLQFRGDHLTFRHATALVPYLAELGISHVYASPCRKAPAGSPHGYAIVDHNRLNPELGTLEDYRAMVAALRAHDMGQIQDIVPNHMFIGTDENPWWNDVLENGPSSPYAAYFDIEWEPVKEELENKILLPTLGGQYGDVLESGALRLEYHDGAFSVELPRRRLPLDPKTYHAILGRGLADLTAAFSGDPQDLLELKSILTALEHLPDRNDTGPEHVVERQREKEIIKGRLRALTARSAEIAAFVERNVRELNGTPGDPGSFDSLDRLLDAQVYRLSHWRTASDEINYRRFFDINDLAAVCMERPEVFARSHELLFELLVDGDIDGLRIDHVDGLYDPMEYLWRLQWGFIRRLGRSLYDEEAGRPNQPGQDPEARKEDGQGGPWHEIEPLFLQAVAPKVGLLPLAVAFPEAFRGKTAEGQPPAHKSPDEPDAARPRSAAASIGLPPLYVIVEKILGPEEPLPYDWPVAGTTGYDFLNTVGGLFVDRAGLEELTRNYSRFIHERQDFREVAYESKRLFLRVSVASELQTLAHRLNRISERHRSTRDFTLNALRIALRETLACFPVYRTYIGKGLISDRDRQIVQRAVARAKRRNPARSNAAFDFVRDALLAEQPPGLDEPGRRERDVFIGRFQQVTSPVMAKGIEDTAFYRYLPLSSLNEVGGGPDAGVTCPARFHADNAARLRQYPGTLTCTTTHDTKRGEDVRARIHVLSEVPKLWRTTVNRWARLNRRHRAEVDGSPAPSSNDEYLFYQALVGVWPLGPARGDSLHELRQRLQTYMDKATREAKMHTSWLNPVADYDAAVRRFVAAVLTEHPRNRFLADVRAFHQHVVDWGLYTALSQLALKLMSPGVPDIYQGQEIWDFSLVDPDNRRPVDFHLRRTMLAQLQAVLAGGDAARLRVAEQLARSPRDPRLKLFVTWQLLQFRRRHARLFQLGSYVPLEAEGSKAEHVCAFAWRQSPEAGSGPSVAVVVAPRLLAGLTPAEYPSPPPPPLGPGVWDDTRIVARDLPPRPMRNVLTGESCNFTGPHLLLRDITEHFPVAVLVEDAS